MKWFSFLSVHFDLNEIKGIEFFAINSQRNDIYRVRKRKKENEMKRGRRVAQLKLIFFYLLICSFNLLEIKKKIFYNSLF